MRLYVIFGNKNNMSRIGRKPIQIPKGTKISIDNNVLTVVGPKGSLSKKFNDTINFNIEDEQVILTPKKSTDSAIWGTYSSKLLNMILGVNALFSKKLILEGIGYKSEVKGDKIVMALGFSHPVELSIPKTLTVTAEKNIITVSGIDKEEVGQFAKLLRDQKRPEPYKGKGMRYDGEVIKRKQGKKSA